MSHDDSLRIDFANFVLSKINEDDTWIHNILLTDGGSFYTIRQYKTALYEERTTNVKNFSIPIM